MRVHIRLLGTVLVLTLAVTLLAALGSPAAPARRGGILRLATQTDPILNPIIQTQAQSLIVNKNIFSTLVRPNEKFEIIPDLATRWEISPDGLVWTFYLRRGVRWHDGEKLTAEDVKFTMDAIASKMSPNPYRVTFQAVERVEVVDETTVRFVLSAPYGPLTAMLSFNVGIVPKHILEKVGFEGIPRFADFNTFKPIGSGPYKVTEVVPGDHITLEAFTGYFGGRPNIDKIIWKIIPDLNVQIAQMRSGELDMIELESPGRVSALEGRQGLKVLATPWLSMPHIQLHTKRVPFDDPRVRLAMQYGLNREAIIKTQFRSLAEFPTGTIPPGLAWAFKPNLPQARYDPKKALELLNQAGWRDTDGDGILDKVINGVKTPFKFVLMSDSAADRVEIITAAQADWKKLGMDVSLLVLERAVWSQRVATQHDFDATFNTRTYPPDPDQRNWYSCGGPFNYGEYCNATVDRLLAAAARGRTLEDRRRLYYQFQDVTVKDPPVLPLAYPRDIIVYTDRLQNVPTIHYRDLLLYIPQMWFAR